ncbi:MAG TPA: calcium/sodium antiporter [Thermoanaerobaculia bacterium]|nr:calcium/sodium antiporter [Thermoanaerobaculia bacterium]
MTLQMILLFLGGLALLVGGGELLVRGASRFAVSVGISPLVVGLTVVAFGTSAPELAVSVLASLTGEADLAVGNVVGSNISNILLILGLSALVAPLTVSQQLVRLDVPLMIGVSVVMLLMALNGNISTLEGTILFGGVVLYSVFAIRKSRSESRNVKEQYEEEFGAHSSARRTTRQTTVDIVLVMTGIALLVSGSRLLVVAAVSMAQSFGVSELVIGLTIVAIGTSLPELATSVVAAVKGERDIAVGNVVGSNLFNILCVLGLTAVVVPSGVSVAPAALSFDIPIMIAVSVACLPVFFTGFAIRRWEGGLFVFYYLTYISYLVLQAAEHDALHAFSRTMLWFVIPITLITLTVITVQALRKQRSGRISGS